MPVTQPRELFLRELADVLAAERMLVGLLPELREQANDPRLREGLERHRHETDGHVKNVEQAFHRLGEEPTNDRCPAMEGLAREHKETLREVTAELHDQAVVSRPLPQSTTRSRRTRA